MEREEIALRNYMREVRKGRKFKIFKKEISMTKSELKRKIKAFVKRAMERNSLEKKDIWGKDRYYNGFKIDISFGQGKFASKPWMAFLKDGNRVSNGICPIISYFYDEKILVVGKEVSDQNIPTLSWKLKKDDIPWINLPFKIDKCKRCYYKKYYKINSIDDLTDEVLEEIIDLIENIMDEYEESIRE